MNSEQLEKSDSLLVDAWERFATYDLNSIKQQKSSHKLQVWILTLGGTASFLALLYTQLFEIWSVDLGIVPQWILRGAVIVTPVTISVLMTASNIFKPGNKWIPLRRAAEEIKGEIYRYRVLSQLTPEKEQPDAAPSWKNKLREKISQASGAVMETEVSKVALRKYKGDLPPYMDEASGDDGFSPLTPGQYLDVRLGDQLNYYQNRTMKFARQMKRYQWLIIIFGGIGTFLAAIGVELWIPLTTTLVGAFSTYLEYHQVESNLMIYNQTIHALLEIKGWWSDLPEAQKKDTGTIRQLIDTTEKVLQSELGRWVQNMESALLELRAKHTEKEEKNE